MFGWEFTVVQLPLSRESFAVTKSSSAYWCCRVKLPNLASLCLSVCRPGSRGLSWEDLAAAYLCHRMCRRRDGLGDVLNGFVPFLFLFHGGDFYCRKMLERSIISITIKAHTNVHCPCVLCIYMLVRAFVCVLVFVCVCMCLMQHTWEVSQKKIGLLFSHAGQEHSLW